MGDKDIDDLLQDLFLSKKAPDLTDSVVEAFLETEYECPEGALDRMRALFVEKVMADLHREPVREVKQKLTFGRWIEVTRQKAHLTREDLANAIGKKPDYIEALETGTVLPWKLHAADLANIVCLFRLHMKAFSELLRLSFDVSTRKPGINVAARRSKRRSKTENEALSKVIDMHLASSSAGKETSIEVSECLADVRGELEQRKIVQLLE